MSNKGVSALAGSGTVYLNAEPGSYVGSWIGGDKVLWTRGVEGILSASRNSDKGIRVSFDDGVG